MTTKKLSIIYPVPQPELAAAIAEVQSVADKLERLNAAVAELPAQAAQADAEMVDLSQRITHAEADLALADGDTSTIQDTIATLSAEFAAKRDARNRLDSRLPIFNQRGEEINAEIEAAKQNLRTERHILASEIRDLLADRIVEKAAELADLRSLWHAFTVASDGSHDWLQMAHVSDPRHSTQITIPPELVKGANGHAISIVPGRTYDHAPNLLSVTSSQGVALVQGIQPVLEPLKAAQSLLNTREYQPRNPRTSTVVLRSSSEGPGGRPGLPAARGA